MLLSLRVPISSGCVVATFTTAACIRCEVIVVLYGIWLARLGILECPVQHRRLVTRTSFHHNTIKNRKYSGQAYTCIQCSNVGSSCRDVLLDIQAWTV